MKILLLIGVLLIAQTWAKPQGEEATEDQEGYEAEETQEEADGEGGYQRPEQDPCYNHECAVGKECDVTEDGEATCVCAHACPKEELPRAHVCSKDNVTFDSHCELERQKCLCHKRNDDRCIDKKYKDVELDYDGPCKELGECKDDQLADFPTRMRNWLYLVMEELAKRKDLPPMGVKLAKKAKEQKDRWVIPVIWKFCDLDHSHDYKITAQEQVTITAPLKAMEPCTGKFMEKCDADQDGAITPLEWEVCLGLSDDVKKENKNENDMDDEEAMEATELCQKLQRAQQRYEKQKKDD